MPTPTRDTFPPSPTGAQSARSRSQGLVNGERGTPPIGLGEREDARRDSRFPVDATLRCEPVSSPGLGPGSPCSTTRSDEQWFARTASESHASRGVASDINIAVVGHASAGKSAFIRKALDLSSKDKHESCARIVNIAGNVYFVRMLERRIEDVYQSEHEALLWPDNLAPMTIHGVTTLYDVTNKSSFSLIPEVLNSVKTMALPSVLVACKCDADQSLWQLDPKAIKQRASSAFSEVTIIKSSDTGIDKLHKAIAAIARGVVDSRSNDGKPMNAGGRRQTLPVLDGLPIPPRQSVINHARSTSELRVLGIRHDFASFSLEGGEGAAEVPSNNTSFSSGRPIDMSASFQFSGAYTDESTSQTSVSTSGSDTSDMDGEPGLCPAQAPAEDCGQSFDALVDRLLAMPQEKSDAKFAAIFLNLYRKFAAPGQLLESIAMRFEALDHTEPAQMSRCVAQLRYLNIIAQWLHLFPGDFADLRTHRRVRAFIAAIKQDRLFAVAAYAMEKDLNNVVENDDTDWDCSDKNRGQSALAVRVDWPYHGSRLLGEAEQSGSDSEGDDSALLTSENFLKREESGPHPGSRYVVSTAAAEVVPDPRTAISKSSWRQLLHYSDEAIAKEMTRMDWAMFSSIRPRDLVRHVSLTPDQKAQCRSLVNVSRMIDHFNYIRDWVINFILFREKPKHRAVMLTKFMQIARKLRELNNYNALGAVLAGVHSTSVHRLQATRDLVPADTNKDWMKLEILMAPTKSFATYRLAWDNSTTERIPYMPLPIRDLVGAQGGNKTFLGENDNARINWKKFEVIGDVLVGIERAQQIPYSNAAMGTRNDDIRTLILQAKIVRDDDALYERSVQLEATGSSSDRRGIKDFFRR